MRSFLQIQVGLVMLSATARLSAGDCGCSKISRETEKDVLDKSPSATLLVDNRTEEGVCNFLSYEDVMENAASYSKRGKMVLIPKGKFIMGNNNEDLFWDDGEHPEREVYINAFYMDETEVTNEQFAVFVEETNYVTDSEKFNDSVVFDQQITEIARKQNLITSVPMAPWWYNVKGAYWKQPFGVGSSWTDLKDHPVVTVSWNDAVAYCKWAGKRLPTEAEWEYACRGGKNKKDFPWGNNMKPFNKHRANTWTGVFPKHNDEEDGFKWTAPSRSFPPNDFGLYEMTGNVWEWVEDWWTAMHHKGPLYNPRGPDDGVEKVKKGGSFMCHISYCNRYRCSGRHYNTPDTSATNLGFRCVRSVPVY
uniref:Sulfatase-modifying factor 1 n=1 Tax=Lygus hesperus TaxID=30085 RepID=A0A0A9Y847_LYGHE